MGVERRQRSQVREAIVVFDALTGGAGSVHGGVDYEHFRAQEKGRRNSFVQYQAKGLNVR